MTNPASTIYLYHEQHASTIYLYHEQSRIYQTQLYLLYHAKCITPINGHTSLT
jgi:hypothetical protein